jgi:hypothetical protein
MAVPSTSQNLVRGAAEKDRPDAFGEVGGDDAECLVAGAALDHREVIEACQLRVELAGGVSGANQGVGHGR